jgi:hypothetical protein
VEPAAAGLRRGDGNLQPDDVTGPAATSTSRWPARDPRPRRGNRRCP